MGSSAYSLSLSILMQEHSILQIAYQSKQYTRLFQKFFRICHIQQNT